MGVQCVSKNDIARNYIDQFWWH